jgi:hypothetical protein
VYAHTHTHTCTNIQQFSCQRKTGRQVIQKRNIWAGIHSSKPFGHCRDAKRESLGGQHRALCNQSLAMHEYWADTYTGIVQRKLVCQTIIQQSWYVCTGDGWVVAFVSVRIVYLHGAGKAHDRLPVCVCLCAYTMTASAMASNCILGRVLRMESISDFPNVHSLLLCFRW